MTTIKGAPYYMAQEVIREDYIEKYNISSLGVIFYVLLCGYRQFNGRKYRRRNYSKCSKGKSYLQKMN